MSGLIAKISELVGTINQDSTSERIKFLSSATKLYSEYDFLESFNQDDKKILTAMRVWDVFIHSKNKGKVEINREMMFIRNQLIINLEEY